jgi:hypothetical protein
VQKISWLIVISLMAAATQGAVSDAHGKYPGSVAVGGLV